MSITQTKTLPSETIRRALSEFQVAVNNTQVAQIQEYMRILLHWNDKVNLTAIRDPLEILHRHFCESMFGACALPAENCRLADVGSGGGFPGLALKIARPDLQLFLIESNIRKAAFLAEIVRELGFNNVRVLVSRYEELAESVAPVDVVCSRALGEFERFLGWAASGSVVAKRAILWVGGRDVDGITALTCWEWKKPIEVPKSLRRYLLVGVPKSANVGVTT